MKLLAGKTVLLMVFVLISLLSFAGDFEVREERVGCLGRVLRKLRGARGIAAELFAQEAAREGIVGAVVVGAVVGGWAGGVAGLVGAGELEKITGTVLYGEALMAGAAGGAVIVAGLAEKVARREVVDIGQLVKVVKAGLTIATAAGVGANVGMNRVRGEGIRREIDGASLGAFAGGGVVIAVAYAAEGVVPFGMAAQLLLATAS